MLKRIKRVSLFLVALLLMQSLLSCSNQTGKPAETTEAIGTAETAGSTAEQTEVWLPPEYDFNGETVTILSTDKINSNEAILSAEETGEPLNDAFYKRQRIVEEKYNVSLALTVSTGYNSDFKKSVLADDDSFQFGIGRIYTGASALQTKEMLYNLCGIDSLKLENSYWNPHMLDLAVNNRLYFAVGDISYGAYDVVVALMFNKKLMADYIKTNPYELVRSGKWTNDEMEKMLTDVTVDLNGDSIMDHNDRYGLLCGTIHSMVQYFSAGGHIVETDGKELTVTMGNDRNRNILDTILENNIGSDNKCIAELVTGVDNIWTTATDMFFSDKGLFRSSIIWDIRQSRSRDTDFGILPYPKYNEQQDGYISTVHSGNGKDSCVMLPATVSDPEKIGLLIDAMCYYSTDTVLSAYYDNSLKGKSARDDESEEMLDIIFDGITFDIGFIYDIGGLGGLIQKMARAQSNSFSSAYAAAENTVKSELEKYNKYYQE